MTRKVSCKIRCGIEAYRGISSIKEEDLFQTSEDTNAAGCHVSAFLPLILVLAHMGLQAGDWQASEGCQIEYNKYFDQLNNDLHWNLLYDEESE